MKYNSVYDLLDDLDDSEFDDLLDVLQSDYGVNFTYGDNQDSFMEKKFKYNLYLLSKKWLSLSTEDVDLINKIAEK